MDNVDRSIKYLEGDIRVTTQLEHYANLNSLKPKKIQDFEIASGEEFKDLTFAEIQIRKQSVPPIDIRSLHYLGLVLNNIKNDEESNGSISQIWFLGQNEPNLSKGKPIMNYILTDPAARKDYPIPVNIMYVTLPLCRKELQGSAKELSEFLLGYDTTLTDERVIGIVKMLKTELEIFKEEKGLLPMLSVLEERDTLVEMAQRETREARREAREAERRADEVQEKANKKIAELEAKLQALSKQGKQNEPIKRKNQSRGDR